MDNLLIVNPHTNEKVDIFTIIDKTDIYTQDKVKIIRYDACKKLANYFNINVDKAELVCQPNESNHQQHIWLITMTAIKDDKVSARATFAGEGSRLNTFKSIPTDKTQDGLRLAEYSGISTKYKSDMAWKRAYVKCVLHILNIQGVYGDIEAVEFLKTDNTGNTVIDYSKV